MEEMLKAVFSVLSAPRPYNEGQLPLAVSWPSSERMLHKNYCRKSSDEKKSLIVGLKGLDAKTN
jgi:hypothetical protein